MFNIQGVKHALTGALWNWQWILLNICVYVYHQHSFILGVYRMLSSKKKYVTQARVWKLSYFFIILVGVKQSTNIIQIGNFQWFIVAVSIVLHASSVILTMTAEIYNNKKKWLQPIFYQHLILTVELCSIFL